VKRFLSLLRGTVDATTVYKRALGGAAAAFLPGALLFLFFSTKGGPIVFALIAVVALFSNTGNAVLLSGALSVATIIGIAGIWWLLPDIHYRPFEKYGRIDHYEPGLDVLCGWLPRCKDFLTTWRPNRVRSCVRPVDAVFLNRWP